MIEKRQVELPHEVYDLARCPNPKCITNAEPMRTHFHVATHPEDGTVILECHYCGRKTPAEQAELL